MTPVQVDVVAPLPEGWGVCFSCEMLIAQAEMDRGPHERGLDDYPPDWQADFQRFSDVILSLSLHFGDSVLIRIWDPRSFQGLLKALRYGVHRYPTFIISGRKKIVGLELPQLERALQEAGAVAQA